MKNIILILVIYTFSSIGTVLQAQIEFGIQSGMTLSHINKKSKIENSPLPQNVESIKSGVNLGYNASLLIRKDINKFLFFDAKIGFHESGFSVKLNRVYEDGFPFTEFSPVIYDRRISLNYVNIHISPSVNFLLNKSKNMYISIGTSYSYSFTGNEKGKFKNIEGNQAILDPIPNKVKTLIRPNNRHDLAITSGLGGIINIKRSRLDIGAVYSIGLLKRNKYDGPGTPPPSRYFRGLSINITYLFKLKKDNNS